MRRFIYFCLKGRLMCQNTRNLKLIVIILFIIILFIPLFWGYYSYKYPEKPERAHLSFYSQEFCWINISDSGKEIDSRTKIFCLESKKIQQYEFGFYLDLSETNFTSYEVQKAWIKVKKEEEELNFEDKFEKGELSVILTIPEFYINSGEKFEIGCKILIKIDDLLPNREFSLPLEIPQSIKKQSKDEIALIGISLPKKYRLIDLSSNIKDSKRKIRTIIFPKQLGNYISYGLIFIELEKDVKENENTIFYFHLLPSENEYSSQDLYLYDNVEIQVDVLNERYWINIKTHVSNISDKSMDFVLNPLFYFVYFPEGVEVQRYKLQNGSILDADVIPIFNHGKVAILRRKDKVPVLKPGEDTWIEIEATSPHSIDLKGKKIFSMPFPIIILDDIHIKYKLELPSSATKIFTGFPGNYLLKEEKILEWNYKNLEIGDIYFFGASFVNNVCLPENIWINNVIFIFIFSIALVFFIAASYYWHQNRMTLFFSGLGLFLLFFIIFFEIINPLDLRFLQNPGERAIMSILWGYLFIFPILSILVSLWKKLKDERNQIRSRNRPIFE